MTSINFETLYIYDTTNNADSVEWCPISPYKNSFACGTYHLVDKNLKVDEGKSNDHLRTGEIQIFTLQKNNLEKNCSVSCPGILDMKWCSKKLNDKIILAVANAEGEVVVYSFENYTLKFLSKCILKKGYGDYLSLSLDWTKQNSENLICSSDSKGNIALIHFHDGSLTLLKEWNAHSLEAWIVCFDSFKSNIIYSGGDEGELKLWDMREESFNPLKSSKYHQAGVTALTTNIFQEFTLVSGSYDENVIFWDTRNWKLPVGKVPASGGLWRLKCEPKNKSNYLLGACIYGGFQVYCSNSFKSIANYKEHESLAYGVDWCHLNFDETKDLLGCTSATIVATCSFYDNKLCVSLWREKVV